ncbi:hypothetical protein NL108_014519 [Boleophthalmus pectinirostris]|nr:hypothetical protein NL108_014519 [Boleophthalmus pectinirostris]
METSRLQSAALKKKKKKKTNTHFLIKNKHTWSCFVSFKCHFSYFISGRFLLQESKHAVPPRDVIRWWSRKSVRLRKTHSDRSKLFKLHLRRQLNRPVTIINKSNNRTITFNELHNFSSFYDLTFRFLFAPKRFIAA